MLNRLIQTSDSIGLFILRLVLGAVLLAHGAQLVFSLFGGGGPRATIQGFAQMGLPPWVAVFAMAVELLGGLGLLVGLLTRIPALGALAVMAGAVYEVHARYGFFMNWSGKSSGEGFEYHLLAGAIALALLVGGGGRWSIDHALSKRNRTRSWKT
jgi:putative oxidoreductase